MNKSIQVKADLMLLVTTIFWGLTFVAVKDAMVYSDALPFLAARFLFAGVILLPFAFKRQKKLNSKVIRDGLILGVFLFAGFALQTAGLKETTATKSSFITGLSVLGVPFLAYAILKKKTDIWKIIGILFAVIGLYLFFSPKGGGVNRGDILTFLCALSFSFEIVLVQKYTSDHDPLLLIMVQVAIVTLLSLVLMPILNQTRFVLTPMLGLDLAFTAIFATAGALMIQFRFQKDTSESRAAIIYTLEPIFASVFAYFIFSERLTSMGLWGAGLIILGTFVSEFGR